MAESEVKCHSRASKQREGWAGSMTWLLPFSLSHDASHTTGRRDATWQGAGPFPKVSREEEEDEEEKEYKRVLQREIREEGQSNT